MSRRRFGRRQVAGVLSVSLLALWLFDRGLGETDPGESPWVKATAAWAAMVPVGEHRLRVLDLGQGPAVLLLHGWSDSTYTWRALIPRLREDHRLIAFDWPGFGYSSRPGRAVPYAELAEVAAGVLQARGVERALVVGNSMGGAAGVQLAATHPERVEGLIGLDAAVAIEGTEGPWMQQALLTGGVNQAGVFALGRLFYGLSLRTAVADDALVTSEVVEEMYRPLQYRGGRWAMLEQFGEIKHHGVGRTVAGQVRGPTTLIWGREDSWVPLSSGETLNRWIPNSRMVILDQVGHLPQWEAPDRVAEIVREMARTSQKRSD